MDIYYIVTLVPKGEEHCFFSENQERITVRDKVDAEIYANRRGLTIIAIEEEDDFE